MCRIWNPNPRTVEENLALLADRVETPQDAAVLEELTLMVEEYRVDVAPEPDATLTLGWTDQSFTRPVSRRERALRAHAATEAARLQGGADTLV